MVGMQVARVNLPVSYMCANHMIWRWEWTMEQALVSLFQCKAMCWGNMTTMTMLSFEPTSWTHYNSHSTLYIVVCVLKQGEKSLPPSVWVCFQSIKLYTYVIIFRIFELFGEVDVVCGAFFLVKIIHLFTVLDCQL